MSYYIHTYMKVRFWWDHSVCCNFKVYKPGFNLTETLSVVSTFTIPQKMIILICTYHYQHVMGTVTIHGLFSNTESSSEYTASNGRMMNEKSVGLEVEGNGFGLI